MLYVGYILLGASGDQMHTWRTRNKTKSSEMGTDLLMYGILLVMSTLADMSGCTALPVMQR